MHTKHSKPVLSVVQQRVTKTYIQLGLQKWPTSSHCHYDISVRTTRLHNKLSFSYSDSNTHVEWQLKVVLLLRRY
jgi:hypothetical protein